MSAPVVPHRGPHSVAPTLAWSALEAAGGGSHAVVDAGGDAAGAAACGTTRFRLLNDWQHDFPRVDEPFAALGAAVGRPASEVIACFRHAIDAGAVSRIGPVVSPRRVGASALVALSVAPARLEAVAARVNAAPEVNHNYEREHRYNLWFVATAADAAQLQAAIGAIACDTQCSPLVLPMEEAYHIDLGFDLRGGGQGRAQDDAQSRGTTVPPLGTAALPHTETTLAGMDLRLLGVLQQGLPLVARPYAAVGARLGLNGGQVCDTLDAWLADGLLRRFGVVLRHHELGWHANAMCVWDVADDQVGALGRRLGRQAGVTLCYRRRRMLPHWRYNLFCMIHGKAREEVLALRAQIVERLALDQWPHAVLFSRRRFKQRGACYVVDPEHSHD